MSMVFKPIKKKDRASNLTIRCAIYPSKSLAQFCLSTAFAESLPNAVDVMESECGNFICIQTGETYTVNKTYKRLNCPDLQKYMAEGVYEFREVDGMFVCDLREVKE